MAELVLTPSGITSSTPATPSFEERVAKIRAFVDGQRMRKTYTPGWFGEMETGLRRLMLELERDLTKEVMVVHYVDAAAVEIAGIEYRRVLRAEQTYMTAAGPVTVERWLYRDREDDTARSISPMERRLGIIGDFWTETAAHQALWVVTQMTPQKAAEAFERLGHMAPSKSSLDRLPKLVSERWEAGREAHEAALRDGLVVPRGDGGGRGLARRCPRAH